MCRIERGYESKFRALLRRVNAGKVERRLPRLLLRARKLAAKEGVSHSRALDQIFRRLQKQTDRLQQWRSLWLDEYFVCGQCGKLFWHGTHWQRIQEQLRGVGK